MHVQPGGTQAPQGRHRGAPAAMHLPSAGAHRAGGSPALGRTAVAVAVVALIVVLAVSWLVFH